MGSKKNGKVSSRDVGLEIAAICGKYFFNTEHLHYGYWPEGLEVGLANMHVAQENHVKLIMSNIPKGVKTILDVGCGRGYVAKKLIEAGYKVDGVSPSPMFAKDCRELLGSQSEIFETKYEGLQTTKKYDLVMFSESFQYIRTNEAIKKSQEILNSGGHILICDIFKKDVEGECFVSGGHSMATFNSIMAGYPFRQIADIDITKETAPNIDIECNVFKEVVLPVADLGEQLADSRYPIVAKVVKWMFRKKLEKIRGNYLGGKRSGENFKKFKTYRLMVYKMTE